MWRALTRPDVAALADSPPEKTAFIERWEREHGRAATRIWVPYERISRHLVCAVVVAEDRNFFFHDGFDRRSIREALERAWRERRRPQGASTLSQQVAKNLWLSPGYSPVRKLREALLTRRLERHLTKRRILEIYLNVAEMGPGGVFGAEAAARRYFHTSAAELGPTPSARLAAGLPDPERRSPGSPGGGARRRAARIERRMRDAEWLWERI